MGLLLLAGATSANGNKLWSLQMFRSTRKSVSSQPILQGQATSGLCAYVFVPLSFTDFSVLVPYSLSYESFLPSVPFCNSQDPWERRLPAS